MVGSRGWTPPRDVRAVGHASATAFWRGVRLRSRAPLRGGDLAPPSRDGNNGRLGRLALAAHSAPGNAAGFGGDTGTVPELDAFRTTGSGASASPTIVSQFTDQHGLVAIGMVAELLDELNRAFLRPDQDARVQVRRLRGRPPSSWMTFADDYICGVDHDQWSSGARVADLPIQEQFEYLLSQCVHARGTAHKSAVVIGEANVLFLAQSTLNRPDIKAVVMANDAKAGRADTLPTDDLYALLLDSRWTSPGRRHTGARRTRNGHVARGSGSGAAAVP